MNPTLLLNPTGEMSDRDTLDPALKAQIKRDPVKRVSSGSRKKMVLVFSILMLTSSASYSQWVVTDLYNGVINTVSQLIQSASKIINSEAFKTATKVLEKLKKVEGGIQQFRRVQETVQYIQSSVQSYQKILQVIAEDRHFSPQEIASFYSTLENITKQDSKLIDDLANGIKENLVEMNSADRMAFIMKIHGDAAASASRLKGFVAGIEYLSLRRARTTNDRLKTMELYSMAKGGTYSAEAYNIDFGKYTEKGVDTDKMNKDAQLAADEATKKQNAWLTDPANPQAHENSIKNLLNDPMPQGPGKPGWRGSKDEWRNYYQQDHYYKDRLELWQSKHQTDFKVLGTHGANFVVSKPEGLTETEWMQVLANKLRKGEL